MEIFINIIKIYHKAKYNKLNLYSGFLLIDFGMLTLWKIHFAQKSTTVII